VQLRGSGSGDQSAAGEHDVVGVVQPRSQLPLGTASPTRPSTAAWTHPFFDLN